MQGRYPKLYQATALQMALGWFEFFSKDFLLGGVMEVMLMKKVNMLTRLFVGVGLMVLVSSQAQDDLLKPVPVKMTWKDQIIKECQFEGLPLSEVIRFLRDEFHDVQLVTAGPVEKVLVDLELRSVGLRNILKAVEIQQQGLVKVTDEGGDMLSIQVRMPKEAKPILKAFSFGPYFNRVQGELFQQEKWKIDEAIKSAGEDKRAAADIQRKYQTELMHEASAKLDNELYNTILTALDAYKQALSGSQAMEMPKLQTHMSSKLVIVIGQPDAVNIVGEIVHAMNGNTASYGGGDIYSGGVSVMGGAGAGFGSGMSGRSSGGGVFGGSGGYGGGGGESSY